jgi:nitroreductase
MNDALPTAPSIATARGADTLALLEARRSVGPDLLADPGPDAATTERLLRIAARVPDHGMLEPWRFIVLQGEARAAASARLAEAYRDALATDLADQARDNPEKTQRTLAKMPTLLARAPLVVLVVSRADPNARKPEFEQVLSAGAVCMNLVVAANALGFATDWLTGWPAYDARAKAILGVAPTEKVAGIIHIGTATRAPVERRRPDMAALVTHWRG